MRIIDEEKVKQLYQNEWCKVSGKLFISATLADTELQNLAIEFYDWATDYYYENLGSEEKIDQLFSKFIEQRKNKLT